MFQIIRTTNQDIQDKDYSRYDVAELRLNGAEFFATEELEKLIGIANSAEEDVSWLIDADRNSREQDELIQLRITAADGKVKFEVRKTQGYMYVGEVSAKDFRDALYKTTRVTAEPTEQDLADMEQLKQSLARMKSEMPPEIVEAHEHCQNNRLEISRSKTCGCFYCLEIYPSSEIGEWVDQGKSALCPKCGIDSVLGDVAGYELTPKFLSAMHTHWF